MALFTFSAGTPPFDISLLDSNFQYLGAFMNAVFPCNIVYSYNSNGQISSQTIMLPAQSLTYIYTYSYNTNGLLTSATLQDLQSATSHTFQYTYNGANQLTYVSGV